MGNEELTLLRRKQVVLVWSLQIEDVLDLSVDLLGFRLLHENLTIVRLQKAERNLANFKLLVLHLRGKLEEVKMHNGQKGEDLKVIASTYIVEMSFHVDQCKGLLKEEHQQTWGHLVRVEFVVVHVGFLRESKCTMLET